jgi:pimeloyl-ACP methyl ester carboxylesterase
MQGVLKRWAVAATMALAGATSAAADPMLADFPYPFPVQTFALHSQRQDLSMAYMDVAPERPNGRTVVLMHGKNFCGATWEGVMRPLLAAGYRVVVPDQIGFCKSSKPQAYQFGFHQLASNTKALLDKIGVERPVILGHSMGGMLAARYVLSYPQAVSGLIMVNPLGLEDWRAEGVPGVTIDQMYAGELRTSAETLKRYQLNTYYAGQWKPEYDRWITMQASMYQGPGRELVAWNQALTSDMIFNQPVVHEFGLIKAPTVLILGERDNTASGKDRAPPEVAARLGKYAELGPKTVARIPGSKLVNFPDLGHSPQVQAPERFNSALIEALAWIGSSPR